MRRLPPLNALRAFEATARHLSFNQASDELAVTPSAVSHQIRSLEDFLGIRLFRRLSRKIELTEQGQAYLPTISLALDHIATATELISRSDATRALTISVTPSFATEWLIPHLAEFQTQHPTLEVHITTAHNLQDFQQSDSDVAIIVGHGQWPGFISHKLIDEEVVPVCSPTLLSNDFENIPLIHVLPRLDQWPNWLLAAGIQRADAMQGLKFATTSLALDAAERGLGIVLANRVFVSTYLQTGHLVIPFDFDSPTPTERVYYLVYPKESVLQPTIITFRDWLLTMTTATMQPANN